MSSGVSRRSVLQAIGAGTALAATGTSLTACSSSGSSGGSSSNVGAKLAPYPTCVPFAGPVPDLAPTKEGVQAGYTAYPQKLVKSVAEKPGDGKKVTAVVMSYGAPPKPLANNKFHQAINAALGVELELTVVPFDQYTTKLSTMMASGDMPDIISMNAGGYFLPNEARFVLSECADLTEHLSGDAIKKYPNLANIPTYSWEAVGRFKGRLYGVPIERPLPWIGLFANQERLKQAGIWVPEVGGLPVADLTKGMKQLTGKNKWAHGASSSGEFGWTAHAANHGAPNMWALKDGAFSHTLASDEFRAALEQMNAWYKDGLYRADALSIDGNTQTLDFQNGTTSIVANAAQLQGAALAVKDGFTVDFARPYKPANGASYNQWFGNGFFSYTALKKAPKERIELLLRVIDFLSAPFGSEEWELNNFGTEGTHFTRAKGDNGPVQTELSVSGESKSTLPVNYIGSGPQVIYMGSFEGSVEATRRQHAWQQQIVPTGIRNPIVGLRSDTWSTKATTLDKLRADSINAVVSGKRPLSDWDSIVKDFKAKGADKAAEEFAKEYEASRKA
ncbi:extracellular solute-binding protein [Streptomyces sp. NPDC048370]|uniref:extracellular solute-binding protein n=1 Tax=Streptomyces sp. NPDC048370 TaxID=3365540 RepID=UPI003718850B